MFIEGITANLYISSPDQLKSGMNLWHVGQGGVTGVCAPTFIGYVVGVNQHVNFSTNEVTNELGRFTYKAPDTNHLSSSSMLDGHILPQTYNNWYYCDSKEKADRLYVEMKAIWDADPLYEQDRQVFTIECDLFDSYCDDYDYDYDDRY